jgi:hypothetical protein
MGPSLLAYRQIIVLCMVLIGVHINNHVISLGQTFFILFYGHLHPSNNI